MQFWQKQLNFAIWCATTECGVDFNHYLKDSGMIGSLFWFHVYYQTRRILKEINAALLQYASWNAFSNNYDRSAYERICKEFNVDVNADWRQKQSKKQGLRTIYNYWTDDGYHPLGKGVQCDNKRYSFTQASTNEKIHIDFISQFSEASKACSTFGLILHTPGPEIRLLVAYIYIDTPCAYPPSYPSIRYAKSFNSAQLTQLIKLSKISIFALSRSEINHATELRLLNSSSSAYNLCYLTYLS